MLILLFALFTADIWLHSPLSGTKKNAGLAVAVAAAASQNVFGFAYTASVIVWIGLLLTTKEVVEVIPEEKPTEAEGEKGLPILPEEGVKKVEHSTKILLENLAGDTTSDNVPWKLQAEDKASNIKVFWADYPGQSIKKWKCTVVIPNATVQNLRDEVFNFDKRCGPNGWDVAVKDGKVLQEYEGGIYSLSLASTHPAGGGAVSSREFLDLRGLYLDGVRDFVPKNGMVLSMVSLDQKKDKKWFPRMPAGNKKVVRGYVFAGAGVRVTPIDGTNDLLFEAITNVDLNGWIPTSVINSVTSALMIDSNKMMLKHLKKVFG